MNENMNGPLRQYFPKGSDFTQISHREVARVELLINERPRKRHDYRTLRKSSHRDSVAIDPCIHLPQSNSNLP